MDNQELISALQAIIDDCLAHESIPISGTVYRQAVAAVYAIGADPFALVPKESA
jgi:hypothetical protein